MILIENSTIFFMFQADKIREFFLGNLLNIFSLFWVASLIFHKLSNIEFSFEMILRIFDDIWRQNEKYFQDL